MRIVSTGIVSMGLVACGASDVRPDAPVEIALPTASAQGTVEPAVPTLPDPVATAPASSGPPEPAHPSMMPVTIVTAPKQAPPPPPAPRLGEACAGTDDSSRPTCGARGLVSATWQVADEHMVRSLPCTLRTIAHPPVDLRDARAFAMDSICVTDDELILFSRCLMCRTLTGDLVRARLSDLTVAQHKAIANLASLNPPPLSAAGWRAVAKAARPDP
jgi:hypothetical protein